MIEYMDCTPIADEIKAGISAKLVGGRPVLLVMRAGDAADDEMYLRGIRRDAEELGIDVVTDRRDGALSGLDGVLTLGEMEYRPPMEWDVDNFRGGRQIRAVTEAALRVAESRMVLAGKSATVIGRGIGREIARELIDRDATVTLCHSRTRDYVMYEAICRADVVFCAARDAKFYPANAKCEKLIVDISNSFNEKNDVLLRYNGHITITARKGGVGAVTRAVLLDRIADNFRIRTGAARW